MTPTIPTQQRPPSMVTLPPNLHTHPIPNDPTISPHSAAELSLATPPTVSPDTQNRPRTWSFPFLPNHSKNGGGTNGPVTAPATGARMNSLETTRSTDAAQGGITNRTLSLDNHDDARYINLISRKLILRSPTDDPEGPRPIFVVSGNHLPGPEWNYEKLLQAIVHVMDDKVDQEYVMVLMASCVKYRPGWLWLYKSYRGLGRKYKKNLKKLYVVHPARWVRMTFDLLERFRVSPKFFRKITYVESLTELAEHLPVDGMPVSEPVIAYDLSLSIAPVISTQTHNRLSRTLQFATPLEKLLPEPTLSMPYIVQVTTDYMLDQGLDEEGLFRKSASLVDIEKCRDLLNSADDVDFDMVEFGVHVAAQLLKRFLRELPEPAIPMSLYDDMGKLHDFDNDAERITFAQKHLFHLLAPSVLTLFSQIFPFLHTVSLNADLNLMTSRNLAIVFAPNLVNSNDALKDMDVCSMVTEGKPLTNEAGGVGTFVRCLIEHPEAFDGIRKDAEERDRERAERTGMPLVRKVEQVAVDEDKVVRKPGNSPQTQSTVTMNAQVPNIVDLLPSSMTVTGRSQVYPAAATKDGDDLNKLNQSWPSNELDEVRLSTSPTHSPTQSQANLTNPHPFDASTLRSIPESLRTGHTDITHVMTPPSSDEYLEQTSPNANDENANVKSENNSKQGSKPHKVWPESMPPTANVLRDDKMREIDLGADIALEVQRTATWPSNEE